MNYPWTKPLRPDQRFNPVVECRQLALGADVYQPTPADALRIFDGVKHSLKTWGRTSGELAGTEPHWIGVCKQTPLHTDPKYPRYTHQVLLLVDAFVLRGLDKVETPLARGTYVVVDTHSPHQLFAKDGDARWYVAVSMDAPAPLSLPLALPALLAYARKAPFVTPAILAPNSGGRLR